MKILKGFGDLGGALLLDESRPTDNTALRKNTYLASPKAMKGIAESLGVNVSGLMHACLRHSSGSGDRFSISLTSDMVLRLMAYTLLETHAKVYTFSNGVVVGLDAEDLANGVEPDPVRIGGSLERIVDHISCH